MLLWCIIRFGLLADLDRTILLHATPGRVALRLALAATWIGDTSRRLIVIALVVAGLIGTRRLYRAVIFAAITLGGVGANSLAKAIVERPRPDLLPHLDRVHSTSYPSGHAAGAMILCLALAWLAPSRYRKGATVVALCLALAIGVSRVMLAVHWPSDVLAGWGLGLAWVLAWRPLLAAPRG